MSGLLVSKARAIQLFRCSPILSYLQDVCSCVQYVHWQSPVFGFVLGVVVAVDVGEDVAGQLRGEILQVLPSPGRAPRVWRLVVVNGVGVVALLHDWSRPVG